MISSWESFPGCWSSAGNNDLSLSMSAALMLAVSKCSMSPIIITSIFRWLSCCLMFEGLTETDDHCHDLCLIYPASSHPRMLGWSVLGVNYNKRRVKTIIKVQRWGQLMLRHPDSNSWSLSLIVADQSFFLWLKNSRNRSKDVEIISFYCLLFWILFKTTAAPASL